MAQWLSPTGHVDYSGGWVNDYMAYNNQTFNYAVRDCGDESWGSFLGLTRCPTLCIKVRFYASGESADINSVQIRVYYSGGWHDLYTGAFVHSTWVEKSMGAQIVTAFAFRFYNSHASAARKAYLHDVDFYGDTVVNPTNTTQNCTDVTTNSATGNGNITAIGYQNPTTRGFCYMVGTSGDPTTANSKVYDTGSFGTGAYSKSIIGLLPATNYRVRAYAINSAGVGYGATVQLTTNSGPTLTTNEVTGINRTDPTEVDANGNITSIGSSAVTRRGFKYGLTEADTWDVHEDGEWNEGVYSLEIDGLDPDTIYYVRAYATNSDGTSYGLYVQFQTAVPYWSTKIEIKAEATASDADIAKVGGKRTLTINNHLIQDMSIAQNIANAYLAEYKDQKIIMVVDRPIPLPYEIGDTIEHVNSIFAGILYKPAVEAEIGYKPVAEAEVLYKPLDTGSRDLIIRKINLRFSAGDFIGTIELEG